MRRLSGDVVPPGGIVGVLILVLVTSRAAALTDTDGGKLMYFHTIVTFLRPSQSNEVLSISLWIASEV
jgi:hypothetical protein